MKKLGKIFGAICLLLFLGGCLSIGSGPLTNSIALPSGNINIKHKLPNGFCLDRSANSATAFQETMVVINCIAVSGSNKSYFSRRPVDTIVNITFTKSRVPKDISQQKYLSIVSEKMDFKQTLIASSDKKIIYGETKLLKNLFHLNFQRIGNSNRKEFIRKYFFLVDNKLVVMTVLSFRKSRKNIYVAFEDFIKKLT